jgi:uncharacterized membrane protein
MGAWKHMMFVGLDIPQITALHGAMVGHFHFTSTVERLSSTAM